MNLNPAIVKSLVNYGNFYFLYRDSWLVNGKNTAGFAWSRAKPSGELREIVGCVQAFDCVLAVFAPNGIIPLWNQVPKRAAVMTERNTAIHAPAGLVLNNIGVPAFVDFFPVHYANRNRAALSSCALRSFKKTPWISHWLPQESASKLLPHRDPVHVRQLNRESH